MKLVTALLLSAGLSTGALANSVTVKPSIVDLNDLDHHTPVSWGFSLSGLNLSPGYAITSAVLKITNIYNWNDTSNKLFIDLLDNPTDGVKFYSNENAPDSPYAQSDYFFDTTKNGYQKKSDQAVSALTTFSDTTPGTSKMVNGKRVYGENFEYSFTTQQLGKLTQYLLTDAGFDVSYKTVTETYQEAYQVKIKNGYWTTIKGVRTYIQPVYETRYREKTRDVQVPVYTPRATVGIGFDADCHYYNDGVSLTVTTTHVPETTTTLGIFASALAALALLRRRRSA